MSVPIIERASSIDLMELASDIVSAALLVGAILNSS